MNHNILPFENFSFHGIRARNPALRPNLPFPLTYNH